VRLNGTSDDKGNGIAVGSVPAIQKAILLLLSSTYIN
jgi:hypothetical protein